MRRSQRRRRWEFAMTIRDILIALTTYPEPTPVAAVDDAISWAAILGARASAIGCVITDDMPGGIIGDLIFDMPGIIAAERKRSAANAEKILMAFQNSAERRGLFQERILQHCLSAKIPDMFVEYARLYDLTIVAVPEGDYVDQWFAESVIFGSGRPTIILPFQRMRPEVSADTVVIAWDFSRFASRAIADALPVLERAKRVYVVTVTNEKAIDAERSSAELAKHLARHGVDIVLDLVDAAGRGVGEVLQSYVAAHQADLLLMGAYGHSRIREFVLGGATRSMLAHPPVPILFSH
jgi:nucleotide-binding universal stress UspA family protein